MNTAIQNCLSQKGDSKRIGKLMSGIDVERKSDERPDFIRYVAPASKKYKGTVVGIELFKVDHISNLTKNNKYQSLGTIHQKRTLSFYNKWRETHPAIRTVVGSGRGGCMLPLTLILSLLTLSAYAMTR